MSELQYRTEGERVADAAAGNPDRPITSGDPFQMHTETQRVADAAYAAAQPAPLSVAPSGLLVHPETGHLVGIEQAPAAQPLALAATVVDATDRRRIITAEEAARRISGEFEPVALDPEKAHHGRFLSAVAGYLGAEPNPANLDQIAELLGKVEVQLPDHEYPKMMYSRTLPAPELGYESHLSLRHDHVGVIVNSEEDAKKLGSGWIENPADLPKRDKGDVGQFEPAKVEKPRDAGHEGQGEAALPSGEYSPHGPEEPKSAARYQGERVRRPAGWDAQQCVVFKEDGSPDIEATDKERAIRGIPALKHFTVTDDPNKAVDG